MRENAPSTARSTGEPVTLETFKQYVPGPLKQAARTAWQRQQLRWAMRHLRALPTGAVPQRQLLVELRAAWDNDGYTADIDYLAEVARLAAVTPGPVLECGSGLTTLLLGALAGRRGVEVWSLEHDVAWRRRGPAALRRPRAPQSSTTCGGSRGPRARRTGGRTSSAAVAGSFTHRPGSAPVRRPARPCSRNCCAAQTSSGSRPACAASAASDGGRVTCTSRPRPRCSASSVPTKRSTRSRRRCAARGPPRWAWIHSTRVGSLMSRRVRPSRRESGSSTSYRSTAVPTS